MSRTDGLMQHGVVIAINGQGVLITGAPGIGKSSLALALLHQGHQLVADDSVQINVHQRQLFAHCPPTLAGLLHSRELGLLDIRRLFGEQHFQPQTALVLQLQLLAQPPQQQHFEGNWQITEILGIDLPLLSLTIDSPISLNQRLQTALQLLPERMNQQLPRHS